MSKNLTLKGLALGAVVTLGASFFAASPAFAAGEVTLAPSAGGSVTKTVEGENFSLDAGIASTVSAGNIAQLKFLVSSSDSNLTVAVPNGTSTGNHAAVALTAGTAASGSTTDYYFIPTAQPSVGISQKLILNSGAITADASATVTAFLDANNNGKLDSGEFSAAQTITWLEASNVHATVTLGALTAGTQDLTATATLTDVNGLEVADNSVNIKLYDLVASPTTALSGGTVTHSATTGAWKDVISSQVLTAGNGIKADAVLTTNANAVIGTTTVVPVSRSIIQPQSQVVAGAYATSAGAAQHSTGTIANDGDVVVKAVIKDLTTPTAAVLAGVAVSAKVEFIPGITTVNSTTTTNATLAAANSADTTKQLTVAGTAYSDVTKLPGATDVAKIALVSDVNGVVSVTIKGHNLEDGDVVKVTFDSQNFTTDATATVATTTTYSVIDLADVNGVNARSIAARGTAAVNYAVRDQFGKAPANGKYRLAVTAPGVSSATTDDVALYLPVVDGKVTANVVDASAASVSTGSYAVTAQLQKVGSDGNYTNVTGSDTFVLNLVSTPAAAKVSITSPADNGTSTVTGYGPAQYTQTTGSGSSAVGTYASPAIDHRKGLLLESNALAANDSRTDLTTAAPTVTADQQVTVAGVVTDANGVAISGAPVTVSGAGLEFKVHVTSGATVFAVGSVSFLAGTDGSYSVDVYSNQSGKQVVTVTSGAATKTVTLTYGSAAGKTSALTLPATAQAGRAVDVKLTVKDAYGNLASGVAVTFTSTGVGYIGATSAVTTGTDGVAATKLVVGAGETGDAVVTATFTKADGTSVVASQTITLGATDAQIDIVNNRVTATASYTAGKTVAFYVDGIKKWSKLSGTDSDLVVNYNLKKGTHTVTVKVSGGFATTEKFIVK